MYSWLNWNLGMLAFVEKGKLCQYFCSAIDSLHSSFLLYSLKQSYKQIASWTAAKCIIIIVISIIFYVGK